jgi:diaminohydroxyphosphoribosylaminopyrimidine deaminase/5-amino-6-(5-phosphoribosylamino)uracil reductase
VGEREARRLNEAFIKHVTTGRPFVVLKCAATLDGQIATRRGDARWISGPASRHIVHQLRHGVDAILVGINTVRVDNPRLTTRLETDRSTRDPLRVILDTRLSIAEDAAVLQAASDSDTLIFIGAEVSAAHRRRIAAAGARIEEVGTDAEGHVDIDAVMAHLGRMDVTSCLIEGGSRIAAAALAAGVIDKLMLFLAPKLLGGNDGVPLFRGKGAAVMAEALAVSDITVRRVEDDVLIEGYLNRSDGSHCLSAGGAAQGTG